MKMAGSCSAQMRNGCPLCVRCRDMSSPSSHCANAINLTTEGEPRHRKRSPSPLRWGGFYVAAVASFASPPQRGSIRAEGDGGLLSLTRRHCPLRGGKGNVDTVGAVFLPGAAPSAMFRGRAFIMPGAAARRSMRAPGWAMRKPSTVISVREKAWFSFGKSLKTR